MSDDVERLTQAMWDARAILGFDNDGDATPAACLSRGIEPYIEGFLADMREMRRDYDDALDEIPPLQGASAAQDATGAPEGTTEPLGPQNGAQADVGSPRPWHDKDYIWVTPERRCGEPCIGGTRLDVDLIAGLAWDRGVDCPAEMYSVTRKQVILACWYVGIYGSRKWRKRFGAWAKRSDLTTEPPPVPTTGEGGDHA